MTRILAIFIALISVSMAVYFMFESQSIKNDFSDEFGVSCENIAGPCVDIEGFWGSGTWEGETSDGSQNFDATLDVKWGPGLAWYLIALVIPLLSLGAAYFSSEDNEESDVVNYLPLVLFFFALVSLSLVVHPETYGDCGWGCSYDAGEGPFGSEEKQFDHRFYLYAGEIVAWILGICALLIGSWITYQLSDTEGSPTISIEYIVPETSSRLLALISISIIPFIGYLKALLLLPHMIILFFFNLVVMIVGWVGLICALFGSYPESVRNWVLPCWNWNWRVGAYYSCLSDTYPPFSTLDDYPTGITFDEREGDSRSKLLTLYGTFLGGKFILLLPRRIVLLFYGIVAGIAVFLGPIVVLLLGKYPESWMDFIIKTRTQMIRINAYTMCLTEFFPPLYPGDTYDVPEKVPSVTNRHYDALMSQSKVEIPSPVEKRPSIDNNSDGIMKDLGALKERSRELCILFLCLTFVFIILDSSILCFTSGIIFIAFLVMAIFGKNEAPVQFTAKEERVMIECPECNAKMEVPKLNKIQDVKCQVCGLSGEIEI